MTNFSDAAIQYNYAPILHLDENEVPNTFPFRVWSQQLQRYQHYWEIYDGRKLKETKGIDNSSKNNQSLKKYPLEINVIRSACRKHAMLLMGEESGETYLPLVRSKIVPRQKIGEDETSKEDRLIAKACESIVNEVWVQSRGRAIQTENALLSQFLGGCVFQVKYVEPFNPLRNDLVVPILVQSVPPDHFVPVWRARDYWHLLEAFVVYRVPAAIAAQQYNYDNKGDDQGYVTYLEHWTEQSYSIYINNNPIKAVVSGVEIVYKNLPNPFGFVPFVYIPHTREGDFWGPSHVDDLEGLMLEINRRLADVGDAIRNTVHRRRYVRNLGPGARRTVDLGQNTPAIDLGQTNPATKTEPHVFSEDPPRIDEGLLDFTEESLWRMYLREAHLSNIAYGEDDVSQRSAVALTMRMFPSVAHSRQERSYWTEGLNLIAEMILKMLVVKKEIIDNFFVPPNFKRLLLITQDWLPQIPRDREQQINEILLRYQAGLLSPERALQMLGDVEYINEELELIKNHLTFQATLNFKGGVFGKEGAGSGAETMITSPKATDGMEE